ncbi:MAG: hypothetical protein II839_11590 [Kiritimatiellae bacterium]|nr:hypothetical protein [Kiritimatiellia bacterium]
MRFRPPTLLESVFFVAAVAMGWYAVAPTVRLARNSARVDLAARSLRDCDYMLEDLFRLPDAPDPADVTVETLDRFRVEAGAEPLVWPAGTDLASFDATGTNGCTVRVTLTDGSSVLVSAASNLVEHAN